jgi:sugar phosphate isomerase/epimerase
VAGVALQLYTVRAECESDLEGALRALGDLGYEGVELWSLHGHDVAEVRRWLDDAGLVAVGRHASAQTLGEGLDALVDEVRVLGIDRVALSSIEPSREAVEAVAGFAQAAREAGLRLGFHNHAAELRPLDGGETFLDLLRTLPSDLLWLELDLGWVWHAGGDPVAELAATAGRCPLVHVKDFPDRDGSGDVPVGDGVVDYERVVPAALAAGAEWLIVEEDEVEGPPFVAVERSLHAVRRILGS